MAVGFIEPNTRPMVMLDANTGTFWTGIELGTNQFSDIVGKDWLW